MMRRTRKPRPRRTKIQRINSILSTWNIEIVSYGLAPNPNGFCYEHENAPKAALNELEQLFDALDTNEEHALRQQVFGANEITEKEWRKYEEEQFDSIEKSYEEA